MAAVLRLDQRFEEQLRRHHRRGRIAGQAEASCAPRCENQVGLPGFTAIFSKMGSKPSAAKAARTTS